MNISSAPIALMGLGVLEGIIGMYQLTGTNAAHAKPILNSAVATTSLASTSSMTEGAAMGLLGVIAKTLGVRKSDILAISFGFQFHEE